MCTTQSNIAKASMETEFIAMVKYGTVNFIATKYWLAILADSEYRKL